MSNPSISSKDKEMRFERYLDFFAYDSNTGLFSWARYVRKGHGKVGQPAGSKSPSGYIRLCIEGVQVMAHRVAWRMHFGCWPEMEIDHINGDKRDNRIANLRQATRQINGQNLRTATRASQSGELGVSWSQHRRKWVAFIKLEGKTRNLGGFADKASASRAYREAKRQLHAGATI